MGERGLNAGAPAVGGHPDQVRALFDRKSAGWPDKYAANGPLAGRLLQFRAAARDLAAADGELLDLGCGSGELARRLADDGYRVTGCDISPLMLRRAAESDRGHAVRWIGLAPDWRTLPFGPASLDAVIAASVLEYVRDPAAVLGECARVLRPGGVLLCSVPNLAHPVRWLEWPLCVLARTRLAGVVPDAPGRTGPYLAYLKTSRQRRRARWWHATARRAGLEGVSLRRAPREPLRLLAFTRAGQPHGAGQTS
jgi:SAM-dependent methyltransferase